MKTAMGATVNNVVRVPTVDDTVNVVKEDFEEALQIERRFVELLEQMLNVIEHIGDKPVDSIDIFDRI